MYPCVMFRPSGPLTRTASAIGEARAFAEHQPCHQRLPRQSDRPARRIDEQHARVVWIEVVAKGNLPDRNRARSGRLPREVQVMSACLVFTEVVVVKLRLTAKAGAHGGCLEDLRRRERHTCSSYSGIQWNRPATGHAQALQ